MNAFWTRFTKGVKIWISWTVPGALLLYALVVWQLADSARPGGGFAAQQYLMILEIVLPALVPLLAAGLFPVEQENGTTELLLSYPVRRAILLLDKFALLAAALAPAFIGTVIWIRANIGADLPLDVMLGTSLPTIWFLASVTVLASILGRGALAGTLFGVGYWGVDLWLKGSVTKWAFLFGRTFGVSVGLTNPATLLLINKSVLVALGLAAAVVSWALLVKARVSMGGDEA